MNDGGVESGFAGVLKMFEERFGRSLTTVTLGVVMCAVVLLGLQASLRVLRTPAEWILGALRPGVELGPFGPVVVQAAMLVVALVVLMAGFSALLRAQKKSRAMIMDALRAPQEEKRGGGPEMGVTNAELIPYPAGPTASGKPGRALADHYAVEYLQPGFKRLTEIRNTEFTMESRRDSAAGLSLLWERASRDLRRDFGRSVELRFNFGKPYTRLGVSAIDDYEAKWIELRDIIRDIRSGALAK